MLLSLFSRHVNRLFWFQKWMRTYILSPTTITVISTGLSFIYRGFTTTTPDHQDQQLPQYYQLLILLTFSTAMFLRFSGVDHAHDPELSMYMRLSSRAMEFFMYVFFLPKFTMIWHWQFMAPLVLLVCTSRSNEVFRIWHTNEHNYQDYHDHVIIRRRFQKFYDLAAKRYEKDLLTIDWPKPAGVPSSYRGYPSDPNGQPGVEDRLKKLKEEVKKAGMYGYQWQPNNQSGFLWADGSGVLMSSTITIVVSIFASSLGREPSVWSVLVSVMSIVIFSYLLLQCVPGFIVFVASVNNPVPEDPDWQKWLDHIFTFSKVLAVEGLPLDLHHRQLPWYMVVIQGVEGLELISYVAVYALFRMIGLGFLFLILSLVRITKLGVVLHWVWAKLESSVAFYFANLTARDVMRAKSAILQAEIALDTRIQPCNHASTHGTGTVNRSCTELRDGKSLLEELDKALNGQQNSAGFSMQLAGSGIINDADVRKQAISVGLFKCIMKDMKEVTFPADIASVAPDSGLTPSHSLRAAGCACACGCSHTNAGFFQKFVVECRTEQLMPQRK